MRERAATLRQVAYAATALVGILVVGTAGFMVIMDEGFVDALYRAVIYATTVGLATLPETAAAKIFSVLITLSTVAIFLYILGLVIELTVSGVVSGRLLEGRIRRRVRGMSDHYIICGYGRMGRGVAGALRTSGLPYVIVDADPAAVAAGREEGDNVLEGNGSEDAILTDAGIDRARGLVACTGSDAENLYIVLTARQLRDDLAIVARATDPDAAKKLCRAGANDTISPFEIAGKAMASMVVRPHVGEYLDVVLEPEAPPFRLEEIEITESSRVRGKTIGELDVQERTTAVLIAHRRKDGSFTTNPGPETRFEEGDVVIAVGTAQEVRAAEELFEATEAVAR